MTIGTVEGSEIVLSGQRAILVEKLGKILKSPQIKRTLLGNKTQRGGYGLELFLNWYFSGRPMSIRGITKKIVCVETEFVAGPSTRIRSGRQGSRTTSYLNEVKRMSNILARRKMKRMPNGRTIVY
jgi:hypothetical protein